MIKHRIETAIVYLLLDSFQTTHPGPSHLALPEQGMEMCLIFIYSLVDKVVFNELK